MSKEAEDAGDGAGQGRLDILVVVFLECMFYLELF